MKISIITTVYNGEKYIEETLASVLSQRGDFELEYIVIDALSSDSSLEKILKYKKLVDEGFYNGYNKGIDMQVISEKDRGMYDGIAKGFERVTGDIIAYINADDFYFPNSFSSVVDIFTEFPQESWLTGRTACANQKGQNFDCSLKLFPQQEFIRKGFFGQHSNCFISQESCFWRKSLLDKLDLDRFRQFKLAGDFFMWYTFSQYATLTTVNTNLGCFRFNENQLSSNIGNYHEEMLGITGCAQLDEDDRERLSRIEYINQAFLDVEKYQYGIIFYDHDVKKWIKTRVCFDPANDEVHLKMHTTKRIPGTSKVRLLGFIPFLKIKSKGNTTRIYLFNFIPLLKIRVPRKK